MTDMFAPDVPEELAAAPDAHVAQPGLLRSEVIPQRVAQDALARRSAVSVDDLARFADAFGDLADPDVMSRAWG